MDKFAFSNLCSVVRPGRKASVERSARAGALSLSLCAGLSLAVMACVLPAGAAAQEAAVAVPAPAVDETAGMGKEETAVLAGGCYWGTQGLFEHVKGVVRVVAGLAGPRDRGFGGMRAGGPAEAVEVTYDPGKITYGRLLQVFFSVAHDPTQLDRQGPDTGSRYRSDVFYKDDEQRRIAEAYVAQLGKAQVFPAPIVTRIDTFDGFQRVDFDQQDYLIKHPTDDYIVVNDLPKIANLKRLLPSLYREAPVRYAD